VVAPAPSWPVDDFGPPRLVGGTGRGPYLWVRLIRLVRWRRAAQRQDFAFDLALRALALAAATWAAASAWERLRAVFRPDFA
jgi:hypothetical protein